MQVFEDKQDVAPVCECIMCGEEIYPGEIVWDTDEGAVHIDCCREYINERYMYSASAAEDLMRLLRIPTRNAE